MTGSVLTTVTIFQSPLDQPGKFVVREFFVGEGGMVVPAVDAIAIVDTLEEARAAVPPGLYCMPRMPDDHVSVVETYL